MENAITAEVCANYCDRNVPNDNIKVNWSDEFADEIWFNIKLSNKEDDYITVSMKIADLLHAIGKSIQNGE